MPNPEQPSPEPTRAEIRAQIYAAAGLQEAPKATRSGAIITDGRGGRISLGEHTGEAKAPASLFGRAEKTAEIPAAPNIGASALVGTMEIAPIPDATDELRDNVSETNRANEAGRLAQVAAKDAAIAEFGPSLIGQIPPTTPQA